MQQDSLGLCRVFQEGRRLKVAICKCRLSFGSNVAIDALLLKDIDLFHKEEVRCTKRREIGRTGSKGQDQGFLEQPLSNLVDLFLTAAKHGADIRLSEFARAEVFEVGSIVTTFGEISGGKMRPMIFSLNRELQFSSLRTWKAVRLRPTCCVLLLLFKIARSVAAYVASKRTDAFASIASPTTGAQCTIVAPLAASDATCRIETLATCGERVDDE